MANVIKHKRGSGSDPSASDLILGELAIRTDTGKLFTKMDSGAIAEIAGGGSDIAINTLSSSSGTGGGSATFNGSAYRFTLSAPPNVSAAQLLVSINGVIQKPVAGTGQPSEGFSVDGTDIILGDAPATGSDFFILTFKSLGVSEPADNSVTSAKIVDGAIVNADINASAAIARTKLANVDLVDDTSPQLGGPLNTNGQIIKWPDSNGTTVNRAVFGAGDDLMIYHNGSNSVIREQGTGDLNIQTTGGNVQVFTNTTETSAKFISNGAVELYHDNSKKFETSSSGAIISGILQVPNGSAAAPAIHFGDSDSGVYGDSSNGVRLTAGGSDTIVATTNGVTFPSSVAALTSLTLGSQSALSKPLYFADAASVQSGSILLDNSSQELRIKNGRFSGDITFTTYNAERMRINSSGKVNIGDTQMSSNLLNVEDGTAAAINIASHGSGGDTAYIGVKKSTGGGLTFGIENRDIIFKTGATYSNGTTFDSGTERMRIDSSGRVGIGQSTNLGSYDSSADRLVVGDGSADEGITIVSGQSVGHHGSIFFADGTGSTNSKKGQIRYEQNTEAMKFATNGSERLRIDINGNVGIGTTNPAVKFVVSNGGAEGLEVSHSSGNVELNAYNRSTSARSPVGIVGQTFTVTTGNPSLNTGLFQNSSGNVGIGTTDPGDNKVLVQLSNSNSNDFEVVGGSSQGRTNINLKAGNATSGSITAFRLVNSSGTGIGSFQMDNATNDIDIFNGSQGGKIFFHTNQSGSALKKMTITDTGRVGIGTTSPSVTLDIEATTPTIRLTDSDASGTPESEISGGGGDLVFSADRDNENSSTVIDFKTDGTQRMRITSSGIFVPAVHNRTTSASVNMRVDSDGEFRRSTSSKRYKKDITTATWGLAEVLKLKPITYKNNSTEGEIDDKTYAGFTAEDMHDLGLTEFVDYNENNQPDALAYGNMVALMAKAIQDLNAKVEALEAK